MIYFIQQGDTGPIKIGYTDGSVENRLRTLQTGSPKKLTLLGFITGTQEQEKLLHRFFHAERIAGEWFEPTPNLKAYLLGCILNQQIEPVESTLTFFESGSTLDNYLDEIEKGIILEALRRCNQDRVKACLSLGINNRSLRYRIDKLNLKID